VKSIGAKMNSLTFV